MDCYDYFDEKGNLTRRVSGCFSEAEDGILPREVSYTLVLSGGVTGVAPTVDELRIAAKNRIDGAAIRARSRYLTPAQEWIYLTKLGQAQAYLAASDRSASPGPYIAAEASATGVTALACASRIVELGNKWCTVIGPQIEAVRVAGKSALANINTPEEIATQVLSVVAVLDAI